VEKSRTRSSHRGEESLARPASKFRLPSEIPLEEYPPPEVFVEEAIQCVSDAAKEGIILRTIGGLAIYLHAHGAGDKELSVKLGRLGERVFTDIDFASYGKFRDKVYGFFKKRGYDVDPTLYMHYFRKRHIYFGGRVPMAEVFFDRLEMNHPIEFAKRLEADNPTIPLAELLLAKLQIVKINQKDIKDVVLMLRSHDAGDTDDQTINLSALCRAGLVSDWGFYHTVTTNLKEVQRFTQEGGILEQNDIKTVGDRVGKILDYLEKQPKSAQWKLRARIGTRRKWYNDVDDWSRA
jgi:hypothetical protein